MQENRGRVLFVGNDETLADSITLLLRSVGYRTIVASTAAHAMQLIVGEPFDFILIEWSLEGEAGPGLCRKIKEYDGNTPVYLYTGLAARPDVRKAVAVGAQGCVDSPIGVAELPRHISSKRLADLTG
jgi:CheY-like chemotaxis protein